ncbi:MAG: ABC transporter permease, partial [Polyangiaceae bacterium]
MSAFTSDQGPPSSGPMSDRPPPSLPPPPPPEPPVLSVYAHRVTAFLEHLGDVTLLTARTIRSLPRRPLEIGSTIYQMESLGVRSVGIVTVTSLFIGMVMTIQFAFGLQRFGGLEYIP